MRLYRVDLLVGIVADHFGVDLIFSGGHFFQQHIALFV